MRLEFTGRRLQGDAGIFTSIPAALRTVLTQPLFQFMLLGGAVFLVDRLAVGREDDPLRIVIDDAKYAEIAGIYEDNQGRPPEAEEMKNLVIKWAQNEVLYREARLMELDKGDEMIRQRLILKLRNVLFNRVVTEAPTEEALRQWFELNRADYDRPVSYDFQQFRVGDASSRDSAESVAASLGAGTPGSEWVDAVRQYRNRPADNLAALFEAEYVAALLASPQGEWIAAQSTAGNWHVARIVAENPGEPAEFEEVRGRIGEDFKATAAQYELAVALEAISDRYDIRLLMSEPPPGWVDDDLAEAQRLAQRNAP